MSTPLVLWHGAHRWDGPPRIIPSRKGRVEYGPGLYLTTSVSTAASYAKGGGVLMRFELDPDIRWLEDARLPPETMIAFVKNQYRLRKKQEVIADIHRTIARSNEERSRTGKPPITELHAAVLVNLMINHGALSGEHGPALAEFYVKHGIDAGIDHKGSEDWVVLFNLARIRGYKRVPVNDAAARDAPRITRMR